MRPRLREGVSVTHMHVFRGLSGLGHLPTKQVVALSPCPCWLGHLRTRQALSEVQKPSMPARRPQRLLPAPNDAPITCLAARGSAGGARPRQPSPAPS